MVLQGRELLAIGKRECDGAVVNTMHNVVRVLIVM